MNLQSRAARLSSANLERLTKMTTPGLACEDLLQINAPACPHRRLTKLTPDVHDCRYPQARVLPASIKFAIRGKLDFETRARAYRVTNERFLILNAWEPYTFKRVAGTITQTLSLFFGSHYLASVQDSLQKSHAVLLDQGRDEELSPHLEFPEALFPADSNHLGSRLRALFNAWKGGASQHCLADRIHDIGEGLIHLRSGALAGLNRIDAVKRSTRLELYRRVQLAGIFIRENYAKKIDLNSVAREAGMAPHHLHRVFRAINGFTVHESIVDYRLREAKRLLEKTEIPVRRICNQVGYSSLPSFTHLFQSRFGQAPSAYRRWSPVES